MSDATGTQAAVKKEEKAPETKRIKQATSPSNEISDKDSRRKVEEFRQYMASDASVDEKMKFATEKFALQVYEALRFERDALLAKLRLEEREKEKEALSTELSKTNALRTKLETLCRELQKQNKAILEDSKRSAQEEQTKRRELSDKFHSTMKEISAKLDEQGEERMKQMRENESLRGKLKDFLEQYELREQHFTQQLKCKDLELQLVEAKYKKQIEVTSMEIQKGHEMKNQLESATRQEAELRAQLSQYAEKFEQFHETLTKSNEVFNTFKKEMEKMSKNIKKLEKENSTWQARCQKAETCVKELNEERSSSLKVLDMLNTQNKKLESLCRTLQTERKELLKYKQQASGGGSGTAASDNNGESNTTATTTAEASEGQTTQETNGGAQTTSTSEKPKDDGEVESAAPSLALHEDTRRDVD